MTNVPKLGYFATPPLRYTGSKWQLAEWIITHFPLHKTYVEPFAGSAAVFFRKHRSPIEVINDRDGELVNFFEVLRDHTDTLLWKIRWTPWSQREYVNSFLPTDDKIERARRYYVSLWQSFGGTRVNKSGWKRHVTPEQRSSTTDTWRRMDGLLYAADRLMDAQISNVTALECIATFDAPHTLFYVDPPYVLTARSGYGRKRYVHEMNDRDHEALLDVLTDCKGKVLLSGYANDLYTRRLAGWRMVTKTTTTNGQGRATEWLWLSPSAQVIDNLPIFATT